MITDKGDILIELKKELRNSNSNQLTIIFDEMDEKLKLISGSTKEHIKEAAEGANYKVDGEGSTRIELYKPSSKSIPTSGSVPIKIDW
jgi:hypothetical protein